ncbi:hypothetical protein ISF_00816 [Cordyceps fumosorosea ARSEF 2679]|uniref:Uncharacterized protein n=1 Tax=Cordyceps fumosorosea (strain ARSEF 2679) TaxID=1081104 RepID=A0A168EK79_CORFA|nr:hypothetical protein ISF_00816 [Cordyceps fumosorosea ARSEF 2679]OAA73915.1 hypothetical protein ISF_00816 [Cordyceps fumosorosea ARSEF 2679]
MKNSTTSNYPFDEEDTRGRPGYYDFHAPPEPLTHDKRTLSYPSTISSSSTTSSTSTTKRVTSWLKPSVKPAQPKVNVHTTCGRHTDQLLFGGPSLTDMARAVFKKKN